MEKTRPKIIPSQTHMMKQTDLLLLVLTIKVALDEHAFKLLCYSFLQIIVCRPPSVDLGTPNRKP